jgi:hypothetical protein
MKKKTESRGRKKTDDPKIMIPVWVNESMVKQVGGKEAAKQFAFDGIRIANNRIVANKANV